MYLIAWLIVWFASGTPDVDFSPINGWAITMCICAFLTYFDVD